MKEIEEIYQQVESLFVPPKPQRPSLPDPHSFELAVVYGLGFGTFFFLAIIFLLLVVA